jgi:peptidoglycan/xylan/chitin deacetylase (PgdA/CDA1 family)
MARIVVFSGDLSYSVCKGIAAIDDAITGLAWLIVVHAPPRTASRLLRSQWRNLRRNGPRWIGYQARDLLGRLRRPTEHAAGAPGHAYTRRALADRPNVSVRVVPDIHAPATVQQVRDFAPDLGLSLAAPLLRPALFELPRLGTLNLHKGRLPDYRGMPPAFWEFWNDEPAVGCSVHFVTERLDGGDIVGSRLIARQRYSTPRAMQLALDETGVELMRESVGAALSGLARPQPQPSGGRTDRKPTLSQVTTLERRLARARGLPRRSASVRAAKAAAHACVRAAAFAGLTRALPRITVLLYHRVTDEVRDNLTVGVEQFERQMALVAAHCRPMSIEDVLACRSIPRSRVPLVAVTFDDGYLDNYTNAAPILERHGIPAAFFVSTGIIGTARPFPHDVKRGNAAIPVMDWDQLRDMRARGFTIGSHSVSHADLASIPHEALWSEVEQSRATLAAELGLERPVFAYPYGGRQNITTAAIDAMRRAGYVGCLSAYGGSNARTVDPFNVVRRGIHWEFDDTSFLLECYGLR